MRRAQHHLPVSVILVVSMTAARIVYPVTDSALYKASPIMIAALRALVGGALLTAMLPLMGSRLPRSGRLWLWTLASVGLRWEGWSLVALCDTAIPRLGPAAPVLARGTSIRIPSALTANRVASAFHCCL